MKTTLALLFTTLVILSACTDPIDTYSDDLDIALEEALMESSGGQGLSYYIMPASDDYVNIPQDPYNPITAEKVALGQLLFHDPGLGVNPRLTLGANTFSCASCHHAEAGFQAGTQQGIGEGGLGFGFAGEGRYKHPVYPSDSIDVQPIRTPSAMNLAWQECVLWNGQFGAQGVNAGTEFAWTAGTPKEDNHLGFQGLETQAIAGQDVHRLQLSEELVDELGYRELFDAAFPELTSEERYSRESGGLAIAAFERTLLSNEAPFQQWLRGDKSAMSDYQTEGAIVFFTKGQCYTCHNGPALANMEFHSLGMQDLSGPGVFQADPASSANRGRESFTSADEDRYAFKVPQLYNLKDSPFYGHGGTFTDLYDVVQYKNLAVKENSNVPDEFLSESFVPLNLSEREVEKLVAFLKGGLYDDNLTRYVPASLPSGLCFPNNDAISQDDLGCE
jgi:cytochrome c peroxidase